MPFRIMKSASNRLLIPCSIACLAMADLALGQAVVPPGSNVVPTFRPNAFSSNEIPAEIIGVWQVQIEGRASKLKTNYNIEFKINDGRGSLPVAIVSYFAGDARRPSSLCRSQLTLVKADGQKWVFDESQNYKTPNGPDACPIWDQIAIEPRTGHLWFQWLDGKRRLAIKMEAAAYRWTGGMECRKVSGDGRSGGEEWCRDAEGNWAPKRR